MAREEEIKQAVENNLDVSVYTPQDGEMLKESFYIGAKWADANPKQGLVDLSQVWHSISEEPKFRAWFIAQIGENAFDTFVMEMDKNNSWVNWSKGINITRWAYIDDLLPKGDKKWTI